MIEKKQWITEIIVKPSTCGNLEIISTRVSDGLYKILNAENEFCKVNKSELRLGIYGLSEKFVNGVADVQLDPSVQFTEQRVNDGYGGKVERREVSGVSRIVFGKDFLTYKLIDMDGVIDIDGGKFLINEYGKYKPNLSFITIVPKVEYDSVDRRNLNFDRGDFSVIYEKFYKSKKGTNCFRVLPKEKAEHILICDSWGGAFNDYRGGTLPEEGVVYYRRASSNGGGMGRDYGIYDINFKNKVSEADI